MPTYRVVFVVEDASYKTSMRANDNSSNIVTQTTHCYKNRAAPKHQNEMLIRNLRV